MRESTVRPDAYTFPCVINACAALDDVTMGGLVHEQVLEMRFGSDLYIGNALIDMYARFGDLDTATKVFDKMYNRDIVSWNSLISGFSSNGYWEQALDYYRKLRLGEIKPDLFTISSILPACGGLVAISEGLESHSLVEKIGMGADVIVSNGLLSMYFKFDDLASADKIFGGMLFRDNVSWNTMICGYSHLELFKESVDLFAEMINAFTPDLLTITSVLRACGHMRNLQFGSFVHDYMTRKGFQPDSRANNILLDMYIKTGNFQASKEVFCKMECKDIVSWNSLINGCIQFDRPDEAVELFKKMKLEEIKPDSITYVMISSVSTHLELGKEVHCETVKLGLDLELCLGNALIDMYAKCKQMEDSIKLFDSMRIRDIVTWNTVISACVHHDDCDLGFRMCRNLSNEGLIPDSVTFLSLLPICSQLAAKWQGKELHGSIFRLGFESEVPIGNALIEMYSKCGILKNSIKVFELQEVKDVVSWTALISAYGMYGKGNKAIMSFTKMEQSGIKPDPIAFISVIFACSHSGLVQEGLHYFHHMKNSYNLKPQMEHYACVVDLLSRSGRFVEAEEFINSMPLKPDASIWGALLSACRGKNTEVMERVSKKIIELGSDNTGYHVLVSNAYASLQKWDQVKQVRKLIKSRGLKKDPGSSWLEIRKKVYVFRTGDTFFEQSEQVRALLDVLGGLMARLGYVADLQCVLHDVGDDEKRDLLCGHSERLAIAFGLLNTDAGSPLQIMKNLRVCRDCHTVTKYISSISRREILVRDANRFHLFKDGVCSCGDLW